MPLRVFGGGMKVIGSILRIREATVPATRQRRVGSIAVRHDVIEV